MRSWLSDACVHYRLRLAVQAHWPVLEDFVDGQRAQVTCEDAAVVVGLESGQGVITDEFLLDIQLAVVVGDELDACVEGGDSLRKRGLEGALGGLLTRLGEAGRGGYLGVAGLVGLVGGERVVASVGGGR